eukprot:2013789-Prymnesium_polylepis.2
MESRLERKPLCLLTRSRTRVWPLGCCVEQLGEQGVRCVPPVLETGGEPLLHGVSQTPLQLAWCLLDGDEC